MKFNTKSIRFNTWLYFLFFSLLILSLLGLLLALLIKPYYRNNQLNTINNIASSIEEKLIIKNPSDEEIEDTSKLIIGNNVCAIIYNDNEKVLLNKNSLGELCMLDQDVVVNGENVVASKEPRKVIELLNNSDINENQYSSITGTEMLLYGKKIKSELVNYYLVINTPLEPIESYIDFIMHQYLYLGVGVIIIAVFIALYLARKITNPIVKMKIEANKLAEGDYSASFKADSYSEINDLASTLDDATNKLSKIDDLRKDLVANVSHDIKTPLTVIQSYAEMIKDISGDDPIKRNEHLDVIIKESEYLNKLVEDMQEYSKMQAGLIELHKNNFNLETCILKVISLLNSIVVERNINIEKELVSTTIYADETKISQVIYNFLTNAIKHSKDNSTITIRMENDEEHVRVEVIDEGDGISKENIPYIWDRYYKIDKGFSRNIKSTGLGLAIAKAILEAHKVEYGVTSKINEGSCFFFSIGKDYEDE